METMGKTRGNRPRRHMRRNQILRFLGNTQNPIGPISEATCRAVARTYPKASDTSPRKPGPEVIEWQLSTRLRSRPVLARKKRFAAILLPSCVEDLRSNE